MGETEGKRIEVLITHINYDSKQMDILVRKYFSGKPFVRDMAVNKRKIWLVNLGFKIMKGMDDFKNLIINKRWVFEGIEVYKYLENLEINEMDLDLELKVEFKNIDLSKIINEQALPKTKDNVFVYELLKLLNDDLDNEMKTNCLKVIMDILNEKRIIPQYIDKISDQIEDLSGLNLKVGEIKVNVKE